jgi:predicted phosphoribosyltransferase
MSPVDSGQTRFKDRAHAGRLLATALGAYADHENGMVLGLPRGGVPVAWEVARVLRLPLDVLVVRKLGLPGWEEVAMGAVSSGGVRVLNADIIRRAGVPDAKVEAITARETLELRRKELAFQRREGAPPVAGKTVLLIDDGIATGSSVAAAIAVLRAQGAAAVIVGAPVCSPEAFDRLSQTTEGVVALRVPDRFQAVGQWYEDFEQISDATVTSLLNTNQH